MVSFINTASRSSVPSIFSSNMVWPLAPTNNNLNMVNTQFIIHDSFPLGLLKAGSSARCHWAGSQGASGCSSVASSSCLQISNVLPTHVVCLLLSFPIREESWVEFCIKEHYVCVPPHPMIMMVQSCTLRSQTLFLVTPKVVYR